jgi:hypothetical protein
MFRTAIFSSICSATSRQAGNQLAKLSHLHNQVERTPAMDTIAPAPLAPPAELRHRRVRLELGPAAAAHACGHVRTAIAAWSVPVNPAVAILLTSDLILNAVVNGAGETVTLGIRWAAGQFRVEVHDPLAGDPSGDGSWENPGTDVNAERGLRLAVAVAADCGRYRTPAGRAVYFVLKPEPAPSAIPGRTGTPAQRGTDRGLPPREATSGGGEP